MTERKKSTEDLYAQLRELEKRSKKKPETLPSKNGVFLLDPTNPHHVEWFQDDEEETNNEGH
ncbi:hypothetical protein ACK1LH_21065 (plasmid) [Metabacillus indicus]|uniref:hypothetical protein n=1 Tax=Metabacillus indicus TaxID=246786 RepID=UPI00398400EF